MNVTREQLNDLLNDFAETVTLLANAYARLAALGDNELCTLSAEEYETQLRFERSQIAENHLEVTAASSYLEDRFEDWKAGDESAYDDLEVLYAPMLTDFLSKYLDDPIRIDEVVQDALAHGRRHGKRANSFRAWIYSAAFRMSGVEIDYSQPASATA